MEFDPESLGQGADPLPIPSELHSVYEKGPFRVCTICSEVLLDGRLYDVQKVFRGSETVLEMAVCHSCGEDVAKEFSEESMRKVQEFFSQNFRPDAESLHCHLCGFPRRLLDGFTLVGACKGSALVLPSFVMCENCGERIQQLLSQKTRDVHDEFMTDHFPGVPADLDLSPSFTGFFG